MEKNIGAFLDLDLPGSKVVVGGGPQLAALQRDYPKVLFTGPRYGEALARAYAGGDVFVFPVADRHVRPGDPGGPGLRHAGRGLPGDRTQGRSGGCGGKIGAVNADLRVAALEALTPIAPRAGRMPSDSPGVRARRCSCRTLCRCGRTVGGVRGPGNVSYQAPLTATLRVMAALGGSRIATLATSERHIQEAVSTT